MDTYFRFLKLCELDEGDQKIELLKRTCNRWGVSEAELSYACDRIPSMYHTEIKGVRRLLGLFVDEWMTLETMQGASEGADRKKEDTLKIYYNVPGSVTGTLWLRECLEKGLNRKVYAGSPDLICMIVLYGIIMSDRKLECRSCRHCAVNVMRRKQTDDGLVPKPDIRITNGLVCDEAPAIDMIIGRSEPDTHRIIMSKAAKYGDQCHYMIACLNESLKGIKEKFNIELPESLYNDIKMKRFLLAVNVENISQFLNRERRFYIGNADMTLIETLLLTSFACGQDEVLKLTSDLYEELLELKKTEKAQPIDHCFTVYYTPTCNPEYSRCFEENGIALLFPTALKSKAVFASDVSPAEDIVFECLEMLIGKSAEEEASEISRLIMENRLDGLVLGMFTFDRWMGAHQNLLKKKIEAETGKTVFIYETDFWNQESFHNERMETSVETLKGMLELNAY